MAERFLLEWPVDSRIITQAFGENPHIYAKYNQAGHEGLDFAAGVGDDVYACADGLVLDVRSNDGNAYGLHVRVRHRVDGLEYETVYAHLSQASVGERQQVQVGERIGLAGNTGHSFAPHLHLTLRLLGAMTWGYPDGVIDPLPYLKGRPEARLPEPAGLTVHAIDRVRLRAGPSTSTSQLAWVAQGERLEVLGDAGSARAKVGQREEWLQVQRDNGLAGFVAAWYLDVESVEPPPPERPGFGHEVEPPEPLVVYATEPLNVRNGPSTGTGRIGIVLPHEPLAVVGDWDQALAKIGDRSQWLKVIVPPGSRTGFVAAWYVHLTPGPAPDRLEIVYPTENMNVRERPTVRSKLVGRLVKNTPLVVYDDPARARTLVGRYDAWLYVETPEGERGWVAAWYVAAEER